MQLVSEVQKFMVDRIRSPRTKLASLMGELNQLSSSLAKITTIDDKLSAIVMFFDTVSKWHDRSGELSALIAEFEQSNFRGQYNEVLEKLRVLRQHIQNAGRSTYGWNRTIPGQRVTDEHVFLGNVFGLFTLTVSYWKTTKGEPKGGFAHWGGNMGEFNSHDIISQQAQGFMDSHIRPMREIIDSLALFDEEGR